MKTGWGRRVLDGALTGAALGVPAHLIGASLTGAPGFAAGRMLLAMVLGGALGALASVLPRRGATAAPAAKPGGQRHVVILGGGFAGLYTAMHLEEELGTDPSVTITLVSDHNAVLFTPMLAEVAGSSLEPTHISTPLRTSLKRTRVVRAAVQGLDLQNRAVRIAHGTGDAQDLPYDQLVLAMGAVSRSPKTSTPALTFKSLADAVRIRNQVIDMFEQADREADPARRQEMLTFVVAGGGFAGVELAGALNDFARGMLVDYPRIAAAEVKVMLVHSRDRILPELSAELGRYARDRMAERGVIFKLERRLADATPTAVTLQPDEVIPARTLVFTAGTGPNPLPKSAGLPVDERGGVLVDGNLAVKDHAGLWALGDIAAVCDGVTGKPCPPTAQFALREARALARNLAATLAGRPLRPFHFEGLGSMCVVGHQVACAELVIPFTGGRTVRFGGLLAWLMWRAVYLGKLPGLERKVRVLCDWVIELFFPRDVVQTLDLRRD